MTGSSGASMITNTKRVKTETKEQEEGEFRDGQQPGGGCQQAKDAVDVLTTAQYSVVRMLLNDPAEAWSSHTACTIGNCK